MKNLYQRVGRHMTFKEKAYQKHWHIDGILENNENKIIFVAMLPSDKRLEEDISKEFAEKFQFIEGFGASDLTVKSNLYLVDNIDYFLKLLRVLFFKYSFNCHPYFYLIYYIEDNINFTFF